MKGTKNQADDIKQCGVYYFFKMKIIVCHFSPFLSFSVWVVIIWIELPGFRLLVDNLGGILCLIAG